MALSVEFKCLYFATVLVLLVLVIMQLWRFGYYMETLKTPETSKMETLKDNKDPLGILLQEKMANDFDPLDPIFGSKKDRAYMSNEFDDLAGLTTIGAATSGADLRFETRITQPGQGY